MLAKVISCAVVGLEGNIVEVEVDCRRGLSAFILVGLPDAAVKESAERVRSAIRNAGLHFRRSQVSVNVAPAEPALDGEVRHVLGVLPLAAFARGRMVPGQSPYARPA